MKITLFALGSRGDVQPFLALAVGLQKAGHHATLVAPHSFTTWIESYGVHTHPVSFNPQELMQKPEIQAIIKSRNVLKQLRVIRESFGPGMVQSLEQFWEIAQKADFVVQTGTGLGGVESYLLHQIPIAFAFLQPFMATHVFPSFFLPFRFSLGKQYNYLTHQLLAMAIWPNLGGPLNQWRKKLGLPQLRSLNQMMSLTKKDGTPNLYGFSPSAITKPPDWDANQHITGYWFLEAHPTWQPPKELLQFLESGPPPIYIGFGSMRDENPEHLTKLAVRALELSGQRGLLVSGWGGITQIKSSAKLFFLDNAPHTWLFPRMAAIVHHGGAGTTGASFSAGLPSIITPFALDQYAWAELAQKLGVGPQVPEMKKLTAEKLSVAINEAIHNPTLRQNAAILGKKIRSENGVANAVNLIEQHARKFRPQINVSAS